MINRQQIPIADASAIHVYCTGAVAAVVLAAAALESSWNQTRRRSTRSAGSFSMTSCRNPARFAWGICLSVSPAASPRSRLPPRSTNGVRVRCWWHITRSVRRGRLAADLAKRAELLRPERSAAQHSQRRVFFDDLLQESRALRLGHLFERLAKQPRRTLLVMCHQHLTLTPVLRNLGGNHDRGERVDSCGVVEELLVRLAQRESLLCIRDGFTVLAKT